MSDINWEKIETIIDQALDLPEEERQPFIEQKCGDNPQLKSEVTLLLESIFDSEGWLEDPQDYKKDFYEEISDDIDLLSTNQTLIGKKVGAYSIREKIGEGGMGMVYRAERSDGKFDHQVAIKIIRRGQATDENIRRFQREQHILAGFNHPNIARLFDGGTTDDGFPYIIMEYISGAPIDDYCKTNNCNIDEKVALFQQVLEAIRYAHENLVIHRDLKPGNILVDENGNVKVLDFGISKLLEDDSDTALTHTGARLLTPRYAAPEQIRQKNITTATDMYALGVVFYKLLTGEGPFELNDLSHYEMEQVILQTDPLKPSHKARSTNLKKELQGDLDAIALKAIRKESESRYRMANEFLQDLQNYQKGLPVSARDDSLQYRTHKYIKRHAKGIMVAAGILVLIFSFFGFYSWRITQERNQAQFQAQRAEEVKGFMLSIFDETNPELAKSLKKDLSAKQLLRSGIDKAEQELQEQPQIYSEMLSSISHALINLDDYESANAALRKALNKSKNEAHNATTASLYTDLSELKLYEGKVDSANFFGLKAKISSRNLPTGAASTFINAKANHMYGLTKAFQAKYDSSVVYYLKADSLYKKAGQENNVEYIENLRSLGEILTVKGDFEQAEKYLQKALEAFQAKYNRPHLNTLSTQSQLGNLYMSIGDHQTAQKVFAETLEKTISLLGKTNYEVAKTYNRIAVNYISLAQYDSAVTYSERALDIYDQIYDDKAHTDILSSLNNLALAKDYQGKTSEAIEIYRDIISKKEQKNGTDHPKNAVAMYNLATILQLNKSFNEAYDLMQRVLKIQKKSLGEDHPYISLYYINLGSIQRDLKLYPQASQSFQKAKAIIDSELPEGHYRAGTYYYNVGLLNKDQHDFKKATQNLEKAFDIYKASLGPDHANTKEVQAVLREVRKN